MPFHPDHDPSRFLAALVESSDAAIIGKTLDGTIVTWNRGAERLYEYTAAEVIGQSIALLVPEDRQAELAGILARIGTGERILQEQTVRRARSGRLVDVSLTISPVVDDAGTIVGAATVARDITAQKQMERALKASELRWRAIIDSAVDGILVIDERGRVEAFNPAAERLFGYTEAEVLGRNVTMLMPSPYREEHDGYLARYLTTGEARIIGVGREVSGRRRDGTIFPLHLSVGEMAPGGERKFTGIVHDLTERVQMETQLREQAALAKLGEMAAVVAHEIKNPLAGIRGAVQVIGGRMPAGSREAGVMAEIVARVDGLNGLMKDLLLFARTPQPNPTRVDMTGLLSTTIDLLAQDPVLKAVEVSVSGSAPPIMADPELLKIVFVNLIVNAAHAVGERGTVQVSIAPGERTCRVDVQDSGPGIPPEVRGKIFSPFFTTKSRGSGLGLPTAKRIVEAHAGRIGIACPPGGGTTVTVELPA